MLPSRGVDGRRDLVSSPRALRLCGEILGGWNSVTDTLLTERSPDAMYEPYDAPKTVQNALTHEAIRGKTLSEFHV